MQLEPRLIANPGSVGQPRDRDPRAAYAIYDSTPRPGNRAASSITSLKCNNASAKRGCRRNTLCGSQRAGDPPPGSDISPKFQLKYRWNFGEVST